MFRLIGFHQKFNALLFVAFYFRQVSKLCRFRKSFRFPEVESSGPDDTVRAETLNMDSGPQLEAGSCRRGVHFLFENSKREQWVSCARKFMLHGQSEVGKLGPFVCPLRIHP